MRPPKYSFTRGNFFGSKWNLIVQFCVGLCTASVRYIADTDNDSIRQVSSCIFFKVLCFFNGIVGQESQTTTAPFCDFFPCFPCLLKLELLNFYSRSAPPHPPLHETFIPPCAIHPPTSSDPPLLQFFEKVFFWTNNTD